jgi:hypothetical protein
MKTLKRGERLLSMCPISTKSTEAVLKQIDDRRYRESVEQHIACAERDVQVTKVYLLKDRSFFVSELESHLSELVHRGIDVRYIFRDQLNGLKDTDIVIFGSKKASVGDVDIDSGICKGSWVDTDPQIVDRYIREYEIIASLAYKLNDNSRQ